MIVMPGLSMKQVQKLYTMETYKNCNNNASKTAKILQIGRTTLWRKLKQYKKKAHNEDMFQSFVATLRTEAQPMLLTDIARLVHFTQKRKKLVEAECNRGATSDELAERETVESSICNICSDYSIKVKFDGLAVKLLLVSNRSNSVFGGKEDGYQVPNNC